ncbi:glutamate 5-kinase [Rubricella aquisinus]|uniref:Glutamate 5-kinase n=1 Tax=Rubricella aquisinus TaxID=2028108 RepID=A0A840WR04_9RHOB|nr:glutamate 5-kinase [Rubricella aquisinus]
MAPLTLSSAKRVVVKIGSALLVDQKSGRLRTEWLDGVVRDVAWLRGQGVDVVIVSSGSIALGRRVLGLKSGSLRLEDSQAAAAVGQIRLARAYEEGLAPHGVTTAQVLLTLDDSINRKRYLNSRRTFDTLLSLGVVPIVNENDTIATDEIRFGDNDRLAAQVAAMCGADVLVLLSDVDGLYTANPRKDPAAKRLATVTEITADIRAMGEGPGTEGAKGGMATKILAAETAMRAGAAMAICLGDVDRPLTALEQGAPCTWFLPQGDPATARKLWIGSMVPRGTLTIDEGAASALRRGRSLLPAGVRGVTGQFDRGDVIEIVNPKGDLVARAIAGYDVTELSAIAGRQSNEIEGILGHPGRAHVVHRDDMAL